MSELRLKLKIGVSVAAASAALYFIANFILQPSASETEAFLAAALPASIGAGLVLALFLNQWFRRTRG